MTEQAFLTAWFCSLLSSLLVLELGGWFILFNLRFIVVHTECWSEASIYTPQNPGITEWDRLPEEFVNEKMINLIVISAIGGCPFGLMHLLVTEYGNSDEKVVHLTKLNELPIIVADIACFMSSHYPYSVKVWSPNCRIYHIRWAYRAF